MEEIISQEELDRFMTLKGEVRVGGLKNNAQFILELEGEEGLKKLEDTMARLGFSIKKMRPMDFYPMGVLAVHLLAIQRIFGYDDEKFREMGVFQSKSSFITRVFMRYLFGSIEKVLKQAQRAWSKFNTVGELKVSEYDMEKRQVILRIEDFLCHPLQCQVFAGLFGTLPKMIIKKEGTCREIKCIHQGDQYHEFLIKW